MLEGWKMTLPRFLRRQKPSHVDWKAEQEQRLCAVWCPPVNLSNLSVATWPPGPLHGLRQLEPTVVGIAIAAAVACLLDATSDFP